MRVSKRQKNRKDRYEKRISRDKIKERMNKRHKKGREDRYKGIG